MVHRLRRDCDAVLVGRATVEVDNPSLTVRRVPLRGASSQPLRVVLDPALSILMPRSADSSERSNYVVLLDGLPTVVYHCVPHFELEHFQGELSSAVQCVHVPPSAAQVAAENGTALLPLPDVLRHLREERDVRHLLVEGGPATARHFLLAGLVDRAIVVRAPFCFRQGLPSGVDETALHRAGLEPLGTLPCGVDQLEYWSRPDLPWPTKVLSQWP
jgi:riboflavin biosynthesis pyrimidine reductase